jgi:predicted AAA+ superfamily ATPase
MNNIAYSHADASTQYPRVVRSVLERDLGRYPVVVLVGARQVGKSTLCRDLARERGMARLTLDNADTRQRAIEDPAGLLTDLGPDGAFIDEAQRVPGLFLAIKAVVDHQPGRPGQYLLSGSAQPEMTGATGDSLLGRAAYRTLRPLTLGELRYQESHAGWSFLFQGTDDDVVKELQRRAEASGPLDWQETVNVGGFPGVVNVDADTRLDRLNQYLRVFATRDIREIVNIASSDQFERFLRLVGVRTGQELNLNGMATDLGLKVATLRRWFGALEDAFLVERVPPWSGNLGNRLIKSPKAFLVDSALAMAAARSDESTGFHLENLLLTDMRVWQDLAPNRVVHHWRIANGPEVDFVLEEQNRLVAVEVKTSAEVGPRAAKHLRRFRSEYGTTIRLLLVSADPRIRLLESGLIAAPWWAVV